MNKKAKFWLLLLLGICPFIPFFLIYLIARMFLWIIWLCGIFTLYCYFLYRFIYKRKKPKYPLVPPEGRMDIYFPRTDIPRPIHEDMERYPEFFRRKKRRFERKRVKKKG